MPKLFMIGGYVIFFWSNENGEPIHVHVCKGKPNAGATKLWITKAGGCVMANNDSKIPAQDLNKIQEFVSAQSFVICRKWQEHFCEKEIRFYC